MNFSVVEQKHEQEINHLKQKHEETLQQWQEKVDKLKLELGNANVLNQKQVVKIVLINQ